VASSSPHRFLCLDRRSFGAAGQPIDPDEDASYRPVADARQDNAGWLRSTVVTADWTFRSSAADESKALRMRVTPMQKWVVALDTGPL
jgi:hypothetical protein